MHANSADVQCWSVISCPHCNLAAAHTWAWRVRVVSGDAPGPRVLAAVQRCQARVGRLPAQRAAAAKAQAHSTAMSCADGHMLSIQPLFPESVFPPGRASFAHGGRCVHCLLLRHTSDAQDAVRDCPLIKVRKLAGAAPAEQAAGSLESVVRGTALLRVDALVLQSARPSSVHMIEHAIGSSSG